MAIKFNRSQTFATGGTVTSAALHNLVDGTDIYPALITDQSDLATVSTADKLLIADTDDSINAKSTTVFNLFDDALSGGTYSNAYISGQFSYGTATGTRLVSTNATITTGTIPTATLGTTTGTAATFTNGTLTTGVIPTGTFGTTTSTAATITTGTIPTLTVGTSTSTAATITNGTVTTLTSSTLTSNLSGGTYSGAINATTGTVQTLTSSTATISEIATTKNIAINVATLATSSGTQLLDFASQGYLTHAITGNITYTASNYSEGKGLVVRITSDGTARNLTFPSSWVFVGVKPTSIAASKTAALSLTSFGTTEANCVAAYAVQT